MLLPWTSGQPGSPDRCPTLVLSLEGSPLTHAHTPHPVSDPPSEERGAALSPVASQTCGWGKSPSPHPVPKERSPPKSSPSGSLSVRSPRRRILKEPRVFTVPGARLLTPPLLPRRSPCLHAPASPLRVSSSHACPFCARSPSGAGELIAFPVRSPGASSERDPLSARPDQPDALAAPRLPLQPASSNSHPLCVCVLTPSSPLFCLNCQGPGLTGSSVLAPHDTRRLPP